MHEVLPPLVYGVFARASCMLCTNSQDGQHTLLPGSRGKFVTDLGVSVEAQADVGSLGRSILLTISYERDLLKNGAKTLLFIDNQPHKLLLDIHDVQFLVESWFPEC